MAKLIPSLSATLFTTYLNWVYSTSHCELNIGGTSLENCIIGFWHGDSFAMNLLAYMLPEDKPFSIWAVVTKDRRGEYIQKILKGSGIQALRLPDGIGMKEHLSAIKTLSSAKATTMCIAMDGPLGPLHQPKKLAFWLSKASGKPVVGIKIEYSKKLILLRRWDKYSIPLPYTSVKFSCHSFGVTEDVFLRTFKENTNSIMEAMC